MKIPQSSTNKFMNYSTKLIKINSLFSKRVLQQYFRKAYPMLYIKMKQINQLKKLLVVFDLSETLLYVDVASRTKRLDEFEALEHMRPDDRQGSYSIYWRKGRSELLDSLFMKNYQAFDVGVWSSLDKELTGTFSKSFFGRHYRNLLFVSATNREPYLAKNYKEKHEPLNIDRDLNVIAKQFPAYELANTVMVAPYSNVNTLSLYNDIVVPNYRPKGLASDFENDLTLISLVKYLQGLSLLYNNNRIEDVRPALKSKNFDFLKKRIEYHDQQFSEYI